MGNGADTRPEFADIGRMARRLTARAVTAARADEGSVQRLLSEHLGAGIAELPVAAATWPAYDQVNVQTGLDSWLAGPGRSHQLVGITGFRHYDFGLAELMQRDRSGPGTGTVATESLAAGPDGVTRACVQCGVYLTADAGGEAALLLRAPDPHSGMDGVMLQAASPVPGRAQQIIDEIRELSIKHNVFRGHVVSFEGEVFGRQRGMLLAFVERPRISRDQVILPPEVLDGIERQVVGVARHAGRLLASGQHLKRGVLLHGVPGTGKTHTLRYLMGQLPGVTVVVLSGGALQMIDAACSVARALQPSVVIVEDVDLIAEERGRRMGQQPLLFELLNEMDGLGSDTDVTFLLTTNRADLLEEALAARPGRIDHAAELPVPDAAARRRLVGLYRGNLDLDLTDPDAVITRTQGVTASFIKELLRRAALNAAEDDSADPWPADEPLRVTDVHMTAALDQLLDTRSRMTRVLLGGAPASAPAAASGPAD